MDFSIRPAERVDLPRLVDLHMDAFSDHRSARLGRSYVRATHEWFLCQDDAVNLIAEIEGEVAGFVEGAQDDYGVRSARALRWIGIWSLLRKPWLLFESGYRHAVGHRLLRLFSGTARQDAMYYERSPFVLVSIAVAPAYQGRGLASKLISRFEKEARERGYDRLRLSVYKTNERAARAYEKSGWVEQSQDFDPHGRYYYRQLN